MALQLDTDFSRHHFTAHGDGYVAVGGRRYNHSVVVLAGEVRTDWEARSFDELQAALFDYFLALQPELVLLGTGAQQRFARPELFRALTAAGIGVEFMTTPAACRTFNILVAEDRKVVAAILL